MEEKREMKATLLVGNGFNHFVNDYSNNSLNAKKIDIVVKNLQRNAGIDEQKTRKRIEECKKVMGEYCTLLEDISLDGSDVQGEFLLNNLHKLANKVTKEQQKSLFDPIEQAVKEYIESKVAEKGKNDQEFRVETTVDSILFLNKIDGKEGAAMKFRVDFKRKLRNYRLKVYTTNYDRIVNDVFSFVPRDKGYDKFDGVISLHGDYKDGGIICTAPHLKEERVKNDVFAEFEEQLQESEIIILFGMSLDSDPHILKALNKVSNSSIILINRNVSDYVEERVELCADEDYICYDFLVRNKIYGIDTQKAVFDGRLIRLPSKCPYSLIKSLKDVMGEIEADRLQK